MTGGAGPSLLESLQAIIERTYRLRTGIRDVGRFVVGDEGYRRLIAGREVRESVGSGAAGPAGPRLLLRPAGPGGGMRAAIYYPDALVERLERHSPWLGVDERNIDDLAAFVEELDHLLCVATRVREGRAFTLLELELHANVTRYLVAALLLARRSGRGRLDEAGRVWLRYHLFERSVPSDPDPALRARYRDALRFARRFLDLLEPLGVEARLEALRAFDRQSHQQKISRLS